jgi:S-ribosylhomocysteine lyase
MDKIPSVSKNHDKINKGLFFSMEMHGITTFDLRFKKPNTEFMSTAVTHTIEHLLATTLRNSSEKDNIIYFGPMGCRTGFYLITINMDFTRLKNILIESINQALLLTEIPGNKKEECGNYLDHNLEGAKSELLEYKNILEVNTYD